jgi:ATP-dependent Lon protease
MMGSSGMETIKRRADVAHLAREVDWLIARASRDGVHENGRGAVDTVRMYEPDELLKFANLWQGQRGEGADNVRRVLKQLADRPVDWKLSPVPDDAALRDLARKYPNFDEAVNCIRRAAALCKLSDGVPFVMPPLMLDGPPGVGKSTFSMGLAAVLGVPLIPFHMTQATASFSLAGSDTQYASGGPGFLLRSVVELGVPDLVVLVDEIDKAGTGPEYNPTGPLYSLLEPSTAKHFVDDGFRLPMNFAHIRWLCTCNDVSLVEMPLRSRCLQFAIEPPTLDQMTAIVHREYQALIRENGWDAHFDIELAEPAVSLLASSVPRFMKQALREALGNAALEGRSTLRIEDFPQPPQRKQVGFIQ